MLFDGITLVEGSEIDNLVVQTGPSFPPLPDTGELFFKNDNVDSQGAPGLYMYNGTEWQRLVSSTESLSDSLADVMTPGTYRSVTVNNKGLVTNGTNPTTLGGYGITDAQPLDADLTAISNLAGISGYLRKTGINTWALEDASFLTANQNITVSGDVTGSGSTSISLTLSNTGVAPGAYGTPANVPVVTVDAKGRVTGIVNAPIDIDASAVTSGTFANGRISASSVSQHQASLTITESQITDGSLLSRNAGNETISGSWTFTAPVSGVTPTTSTHLTTKAYVDSLSLGLDFKESVRAATTANIALTGLQTVDGVGLADGNRVLVKDQSTASQNGIYIARVGIWERAQDADGSPSSEVSPGMFCFVEEGTSNDNTGWVLATNGNISVGSTSLNFVKFTGAPVVPTGPTVSYGVSAAGTTQATATTVSDNTVVVTTVAAGSGVRLNQIVAESVVVVNRGLNALNVYPASGANIDALAINSPLQIPVGARIMFIRVSANEFVTLNATYA